MFVFGLLVGGAVVGIVAYLKNASYKKHINADVTALQSAFAGLRTKSVSDVKIVEDDFKSVSTAFTNLFKKL